MKGDEDRPISS